MDNSTVSVNRIRYVEPNNLYSDLPNNVIPQEYEDYCITVILEVDIYDRTDRSKKETQYYKLQNPHTNFLGGTDGYLSTSYTDISLMEPGTGNKEMLGITSIDIAYNSWFFPQVTITFVDVRGASLMSPQEFALDETIKSEKKEDGARGGNKSIPGTQLIGGSYFKALFTFPYPEFRLKVKGFYGDGITLRLCVEKCNIRFNAQTGNFEAVANFIGYMFGVYTDIPMQMLSVAPYVDPTPYNGFSNDSPEVSKLRMYNSIWAKGISDGGEFYYEGYSLTDLEDKNFDPSKAKVDRQREIMTYPELSFNLHKFMDNEEKIMASSEEGQELLRIQNEIGNINDLKALYPYGTDTSEGLVKNSVTLSNGSALFWAVGQQLDGVSNEIVNFYDKLIITESVEDTSDDLSLKASDAIVTTTVANVGETAEFVKLFDLATSVDTQTNTLVIKLSQSQKFDGTNVSITFSGGWEKETVPVGKDSTKTYYTLRVPINNDKIAPQDIIKEYLSKVKIVYVGKEFTLADFGGRITLWDFMHQRHNVVSETVNYIGFSYLYFDIMDKLNSLTNSLENKEDSIKKSVNSIRGAKLSKTLGFTPTIKNMYKMAFAHLDTFMNLYYNCLDLIDDNIAAQKRKFSVPENVSIDFPLSDRKDFDLPPYTKFFRKENDEYKEFFPSLENLRKAGFGREVANLQGHELDEVTFVRKLLSAAKLNGEIQAAFAEIDTKMKEEAKKENEAPTFNDIKDFVPLTPYDFNSLGTSYSPYDFLNECSQNDLIALSVLSFLTRLYDVLLFEANNDHKKMEINFNFKRDDTEGDRQNILGEIFGKMEAFNIVNKLEKGNEGVISALIDISENGNGHNADFIIESLYGQSTAADGQCNVLINNLKKFATSKVFEKTNSGCKYVYKNNLLPLNNFNYNEISKTDAKFDYINLLNLTESFVSDSETSFMIYNNYEALQGSQKQVKELLNGELSDTYDDFCKALNAIFNKDTKDEIGVNFINSNYVYVFSNPLYYYQKTIEQRAFLFLFSIINSRRLWRNESNNKLYYNISADNGATYFVDILKEGAVYYAEDNVGNKDNFIDYPLSFISQFEDKKLILPVVECNGSYAFGMFKTQNGSCKKTDQAHYFKNLSATKDRREKCKKLFEEFVRIYESSIEPYLALHEVGNATTPSNLYTIDDIENTQSQRVINDSDGLIVGYGMEQKITATGCTKVESQDQMTTPGTFILSDEGGYNRDIKIGSVVFSNVKGVIFANTYNGNNCYFEIESYKSSKNNKYEVTYLSNITSSVSFSASVETDKVKEIFDYDQTRFICDSVNIVTAKEGDTNFNSNVKEKALKKGLKSFFSEIKDLYAEKFGTNGYDYSDEPITSVFDEVNYNEDMELSVYNTLSDLYNKWLATRSKYTWTLYPKDSTDPNAKLSEVSNAFYFIDSFYRDIGNDILVNATVIDEVMQSHIPSGTQGMAEGDAEGNRKSLLQFLTLMAQRCEMLFLALPIDFGMPKANFVENMFKAKPYMKSVYNGDMSKMMSFVCIYTSKPSQFLDVKGSQYKNDSFTISQDFIDTTSGLFSDEYGNYEVPAFGVTYGKQNQSYFTNVELNMENAQVTEYSIAAMMNITSKAAEGDRSTTLYGQDLYRVYSNYSYQCTVEMMGCAQIIPLMYFQLNNIPMWKGAYMISNVKHSIRPGSMKTTFTGIRISKYMVPYTKPYPDYEDNGDVKNGSAGQEPTYENTANNNKPVSTATTDGDCIEYNKESQEGRTILENFLILCKNSGWDEADAMRAILTARKCSDFTFEQGKKGGLCARWTYRLASALIKGTPNVCNITGKGNADQVDFRNNLGALGYTMVDFSKDGLISTEEMKNILNSNNYGNVLPYGGIIVYVSDNGANGKCPMQRHATIYLGENKIDKRDTCSKWWCDVRYGRDYVYGKFDNCGYKWQAYGFVPPKKQ